MGFGVQGESGGEASCFKVDDVEVAKSVLLYDLKESHKM